MACFDATLSLSLSACMCVCVCLFVYFNKTEEFIFARKLPSERNLIDRREKKAVVGICDFEKKKVFVSRIEFASKQCKKSVRVTNFERIVIIETT